MGNTFTRLLFVFALLVAFGSTRTLWGAGAPDGNGPQAQESPAQGSRAEGSREPAQLLKRIGGDLEVTHGIAAEELRGHVQALSHDLLRGRKQGTPESMVHHRPPVPEVVSISRPRFQPLVPKSGDWKVSELESVRIYFLPVLEEIGKCQNWKVSELESVRIGKCQNRKVSELESVRIFLSLKIPYI